ncbi:MAG: glycosyltransferase family 4 protein [Pseudomonadota bacterium]
MRLGLARLKYEPGGGAETTLGLLARGLLERGHQVHVLTSVWQGAPPAGLTVHALPAPGRGAGRLRAFANAARRQAGSLGLDTWLSLERVPGAPVFRAGDGCHAAWLKRRAAYEGPFKRWSFAFNPLHRAFLDLERRTLAAPELRQVIANSRLVAGELAAYYGLGPERVRVVYNAVDEARLAPALEPATRARQRQALGLSQGEPVLLFLGSGFERKGLAFALKALARLPGARLLVAGRDRAGAYQRLARRLGIAGRVSFLGQAADVAGLLAAADALLLPTIYDPCANSCLEALHVGLPVVTTLANGAAELVRQGVSGCLVAEPADDQALARACQRAWELTRPVPHDLPSRRQWLDQTLALLEGAARG